MKVFARRLLALEQRKRSRQVFLLWSDEDTAEETQARAEAIERQYGDTAQVIVCQWLPSQDAPEHVS